MNPGTTEIKPEILLKAYLQYQSEDAFRELVAATLDEVYSTSFRVTQGAQRLAEETTFNAYLDLARRAPGIREDVELASWLRKRACKIAVRILRATERDINWAIVKREKKRSTPAEAQPAPPGLAIYICKTVLLSVKRRRSYRLMLPRISWPAWIRPVHAGGAVVCALALLLWWHHPFHHHNRIAPPGGALMRPTSFAQLGGPEEMGDPVENTNALTTNQK